MAALAASLGMGCGGELNAADASSESPNPVALESVSTVIEQVQDTAASESEPLTQAAFAGSCPTTTLTWFQYQPSWNGNPSTAGYYYCSANVNSAPSGVSQQVWPSSSARSGSATFYCSSTGQWVQQTGSCDGAVISTLWATGIASTCYDSDPVRSKWIGWYLADLKRCPDTDGLNYWVNQDRYDPGCSPSDNYRGYGSRDNCLRAIFRYAANTCGNSYNESQATGHISAWGENAMCGAYLAYPWTGVSWYGTSCKYKP